MKTCRKCNTEKSLSEFHKDKLRPDGLFPYCKTCRIKPKKKRNIRPISEVLSNYTVSKSGCWNWNGVINTDGYGMACYQGEQVRAHRLSLLNHLGLEGSELLALHHCDNRRCINPDHLYLGTNQDNSNDMVNRDRANPLRGEDSALSKITEEQAASILIDTRPHQKIAEDHSVSKSTVSSIKTGRRWKHIQLIGPGKS